MCCNLVFIIGFSLLFILAIIYIILHHSIQKKILELNEFKVNADVIITEEFPKILDIMIMECFNDYNMMILVPKGEEFITDEREAEIRLDLAHKVSDRLSPRLISKLSAYYNIQSIGDIVAEKVYITVTNYVVRHNAELKK